MNDKKIDNTRILSERLLPTPDALKSRIRLSPQAEEYIFKSRQQVCQLLDHSDPRFMLVIGPCSIHDIDAAREYAQKLKQLSEEVRDTLLVVMRVYFEKPRTSVGWKGFINDPLMNDSFQIEEGLSRARELLVSLAELGIPVGTEALDPITIQYISDLISWAAIGARTTESQTHREMASGLSVPVGFKNGTDGNIDVAINALRSAAQPHRFLGINQQGQCTVLHTAGNTYGHVVLRGGAKPNYDAESIAACADRLRQAKLPVNIMIDCSHGNSLKDYRRQSDVLADSINQIISGSTAPIGWMIESNLFEGQQVIPTNLTELRYGVSVTDACIGWEETVRVVRAAHTQLQPIIKQRVSSLAA